MSENLKLIKKHEPHTACAKGNHTYIVTVWQTGGGKEKAIAMKCQHCLMPLDLTEIDTANWADKAGI